MLASGDGKGLETAVLETGRRRRSLSGLRDGGARKGRRRPIWKDLKTVELARARRRYRAGPGLEYGGAGQSSETVELFRGSEMAKLAGDRRRRNLLGLGDSGAGKGSKKLIRARRPQSWSGLRDGGAAPGLGDGGAGLWPGDDGADQ